MNNINIYKPLNESYSIDKINYIGKKLLKDRCNYPEFKSNFSIVFMSDTHTDHSTLKYYSLLLNQLSNYDDILCIIHGGDAIHGTKNANTSCKRLIEFINSTNIQLYENKKAKEMIPFFINIGNHDYRCKNRELVSGGSFKNFVEDTSNIIKIYSQPLDIIMLNTGYTHNGFPKIKPFTKQLRYIEEKIKKTSKRIQYIVDMHIPPQIGSLSNYSNHTLNAEQTNEFINFLDKYNNRILAVITHHIHHFNEIDTTSPIFIYPKGNIPIYMVSNADSRYKCIKMSFERQQDGSVKIKRVVKISL